MLKAKLIIVSGPSATGKTILSQKLAEQFRLPLFVTDKLKEIVFDQVGNWEEDELFHRVSRASFDLVFHLGFDEDFEADKRGEVEVVHYIFLVFLVKYLSGEIKADDDIERLARITREKLSEVALTRPAIKLFRRMGYLGLKGH